MQSKSTTHHSHCRLYLTAMVPFALLAVNWRYPLFGWSEPVSGTCIQLAAWFLPWFALIAVSLEGSELRQFLGGLALTPLLVMSVIAIPWSFREVSMTAKYGKNVERERIATLYMPNGSELVTYKLDCGFICAVQSELRQETTLLGPLKVVHVVTGRGGEGLCARVVDATHVMVEGDSYPLRPHIWF